MSFARQAGTWYVYTHVTQLRREWKCPHDFPVIVWLPETARDYVYEETVALLDINIEWKPAPFEGMIVFPATIDYLGKQT